MDVDEFRIFLCIVFGFGIILEAILLVNWYTSELGSGIFVSLGISLLTFAVGFLKAPELGLYTHIFISFMVFSGVFGIFFRKEILPVLNEGTLLVLSIALWYVFFAYYPSFTGTTTLLICLILIPMTMGTLLLAFTNYVVGPELIVVLYTWFLVMVVSLGLAQFPIWSLSLFFNRLGPSPLGFLDVLLTGMVSAYIVINATYILALVPIPWHRRQDFTERWREVRVHAKILIQKYSDHQLEPRESLLIILILGGLLFTNSFLKLIPDHLAVNTLIVIVPQIAGEILKRHRHFTFIPPFKTDEH